MFPRGYIYYYHYYIIFFPYLTVDSIEVDKQAVKWGHDMQQRSPNLIPNQIYDLNVQMCKMENIHRRSNRDQNNCKSKYVCLFTLNTVRTAKLESTLLSSNLKLKYYDTSHINICISNSSNRLTNVTVNIFFSAWALAQYKSHIYRHLHMYLHSIFLHSIEKINSITFIGTLFINTLCILVDDRARAHDWLTACDILAACQITFLSNPWPSKHCSSLKGAICKNWPLVKFILQTDWGQHVSRIGLSVKLCYVSAESIVH